MPRRLAQRDRSSVAQSSPAHHVNDARLPNYEPPSCPLNERALRALGELSHNREIKIYESHLKDSIMYLGASVSDLHERHRSQQERLANFRRRREEKGTTEKTADEERLEGHLSEFGPQVDSTTRDSERAVRELVDCRAEVEDQLNVLGELRTIASSSQGNAGTIASGPSRRRGRRGDANTSSDDEAAAQEDEGEAQTGDSVPEPPARSIRDTFVEECAKKRDQFENMSMHERYALNNDYAGFKKLWHDATQGHDGAPLPDASRWFRADGQPVLGTATSYDGGTKRATHVIRDVNEDGEDGEGEEEDEGEQKEHEEDGEIEVAREVLSLRCPLTLRTMEEPYSNHKCKHTFEKSAILDYLSGRGGRQCPQTGCSQTFTRAKFNEDFYLDQLVLRRIQRAKQAEDARDDMDVEEGDDGFDVEMDGDVQIDRR